MKTRQIFLFFTRAAAVITATTLFQPAQAAAAGKVQSLPHLELQMFGPVFTRPDHTQRVDPDLWEWDQCRENGLNDTQLAQRQTTMNFYALLGDAISSYASNLPCPGQPGDIRRAVLLEFGKKSAGPGSSVTFSLWLTKNCELTVTGHISSGQWPLQAGSPGPALVITIPARAPWTFNRYGGGAAECSGAFVLPEEIVDDVTLAVRRYDNRTSAVCDCPSDYTDDNAANSGCPDCF